MASFFTDPTVPLTIQHLTPNVTTVSAPFALLGGRLQVGSRATLVRISPSGAVLVFCPTHLTPAVRREIARLNGHADAESDGAAAAAEVAYLVPGNRSHHLALAAWRAAFPAARVVAPRGLFEKRRDEARKNGEPDEAPFDFVLDAANDAANTPLPAELTSAGGGNVDILAVPGTANGELLLHHASGVIATVDMMTALPVPSGGTSGDAAAAAGIVNRLAASLGYDPALHSGWRMQLRRLATRSTVDAKERARYDAAVQTVLREWIVGGEGKAAGAQFLVPCHGEIIEGNDRVRRVWEGVFRWHLGTEGGN